MSPSHFSLQVLQTIAFIVALLLKIIRHVLHFISHDSDPKPPGTP